MDGRALATTALFCNDARYMPQKELLSVIQQLKRWREQNEISQSQAVRVLAQAGIKVTIDSLQAWEIGRWSPRANVALALAEYLKKHSRVKAPKTRPGRTGVPK
jgi:DNA-binding transcriptional regulator YiaG